MTWKAHAEDTWHIEGPTIRAARLSDKSVSEVIGLTLEDRQVGTISTAPPMLSGPDAVGFMQAVMDAAYQYGLRPSQQVDEAGVKEHLKDMRDIARHLLKMNAK